MDFVFIIFITIKFVQGVVLEGKEKVWYGWLGLECGAVKCNELELEWNGMEEVEGGRRRKCKGLSGGVAHGKGF